MSACQAGDSVARNFHALGVGFVIRAFARVAGSDYSTTIHLGLTPQALCFRPLSRAGLHYLVAFPSSSSPSFRILPEQRTLAGEFDQDRLHCADEPL